MPAPARLLTRLSASTSNSVRAITTVGGKTIDKPDSSQPSFTAIETDFSEKRLKFPLARYGGRQMVTVIPGDGIGPEMTSHVRTLFNTAQVPVDFEEASISDKDEELTQFNKSIMSIERNGVALMGNIETAKDPPGVLSRNVNLRMTLDLFAHMIHARNVPTIQTRHKDVDIVIIRENIEGEYSGLEHETVPGVVESLKIITRKNIERIARFTFEYARTHDRKKVTAVHKANIMKIADGYFLKVCGQVAQDYPEIQFENMIVDNASMQLVSRPQQFDVMVMPNLYGNIISNIAVGLCGGPGIFSGRNLGPIYSVFETATRGTGTQLTGQNIANPVGFLRAGVDMLRHLGKGHLNHHVQDRRILESANTIENAMWRVLLERNIRTADLCGTASTSEVVAAIKEEIERDMEAQLQTKLSQLYQK